ncbi:XRE family transcriptional regulator [Skermanella stibiiresistens SB22]|uniref:XRE family transcriptional regulator n=1 Tax=Skermanella stibiiresistens SB22 TaxID=1385369 RepID=W9H0R9_9PROT|nr:helix-turn-helix transcriptional regulator [Skermanella stibiiresistens]EWY38436.1 XRE family transcriptional regulator [Skermanella stibiiresistens SB22]
MLDFGRSLRRLRRLNGIKQDHLAELAGVTQATVSRWESGRHQPTPEQVAKLLPLLEARLDPSGDAMLRRLVETSSLRVHLVCDVTHQLLAVSEWRRQEWRNDAQSLYGETLWPFASDGIRDGEAKLVELGWYEPVTRPIAGWTDFNFAGVIRMGPGMWLWERVQLSDGRFARLVTSLPLDDLRRSVPAARIVSLPPEGVGEVV